MSGYVLVDNASARVINFELEGEYDMIHFRLLCRMNEDGEKSLRPKQCDVTAKVSVTGNRIFTWFTCVYDLPRDLPDSIDNSEDPRLMQSVRPIPLTPDEERVMADFNSARNARIQAVREQAVRDSLAGISPKAKKENWAKYVFWDIIGDNMLNRIHADLGQNRQGHLRVGPIFNPLYFGFTRRKGLNYNFTPNRDLSMRVKMGYSFRQRHTYFNVPFNFNFNKRRNGYVRVDFGNGNRITNSRVLEEVKAEKKDSINWGKMHLDYLKDMNLKMGVNYDVLKNRLGVQGGFVAHRRSTVHKQGFIAAGKPTVYKTVAPYLRLQYRPWGDEGPILTSDYERSFKGLCGSMTNYERWEFDGQFLHKMSRMRAWSMRGGVGLYSSKVKTTSPTVGTTTGAASLNCSTPTGTTPPTTTCASIPPTKHRCCCSRGFRWWDKSWRRSASTSARSRCASTRPTSRRATGSPTACSLSASSVVGVRATSRAWA